VRVGAIATLTLLLQGQSFFHDHASPFGFAGYGGYPKPWVEPVGHPAHMRQQRSLRQLPPCPQYRPLSLSEWSRTIAGHVQLRASLPGVASSHRWVWLSEDKSALHLRALRPLPARGASCLPQGAQLSADGRFEIFETTVPVPTRGDTSRATLREVANGLQITLPLRAAASPGYASMPALSSPQSVYTASGKQAQARQTSSAPTPAAVTTSVGGDRSARTVAMGAGAPASTLAAASPTPEELALAQDVEIVEKDYPWPEKRADAAEGWWDNRGEFQYY